MKPNILFHTLIAVVILVASTITPASARSISFIRDTEIENTIRTYATPLFEAAGLDPASVRIFLVNDRSLNAFVAGGQNLFINTGLLMRAEDAGQVIGVIAHEAGHIAGGHLSRVHDALERGAAETILALVLGAAAGLATGRPDLAGAIIGGGQNVAVRNFLQYSRTQEGAADAAALSYLDETEQSARGLMEFFEVLSGQELLSPSRQDPYIRTHPLTRERIEAVKAHVATSEYSDRPLPESTRGLHARMRAKLFAFLDDPQYTMRRYPPNDDRLVARYARAVAYHRAADLDAALAEIEPLLAQYPEDPYFHELKGQILFESGRVDAAYEPYQTAAMLLPDAPLIRANLAQVQIAKGDPESLRRAVENLEASLRYERQRPSVWRQLGIAQGRLGNEAESALALAEEAMLRQKYPEAKFHAGKAEQMFPQGSPGWLKAQDILSAISIQENRG